MCVILNHDAKVRKGKIWNTKNINIYLIFNKHHLGNNKAKHGFVLGTFFMILM